MIIEENELIRCELDESIPVLKHRWLKKPSSEELQKQLVQIQKKYINLKKEYSNLKWLADTELLGELTEDDESWLKETWEKLLFEEAGVQVHAVILGHDIYADYSMEFFKTSAEKIYSEKGVKLGVFLNEESAYGWLRETS